MSFFQDYRKVMGAGFVLALIIIATGTSGEQPSLFDLARWGHFLAGVIWIGLLYYFNVVQVPALAAVSAETKADLFKAGGLVRTALNWFRFSAMFTLLFGLILYYGMMNGESASGVPGMDIRIGALFGIIMWVNVAFVIWPNQKKVIGIVEATAEEKLAAGKKALIASRINVLLSIPMLLLMASSAHFRLFS